MNELLVLSAAMLRRGRPQRLGSERVLQLLEWRRGVARGLRRALQLLQEQTSGYHQEQAVRIRC